MGGWTYKTVPAPTKAPKVRGVGGPEARLAHAMGELIAAEARDGWEYLRADSLPVEEGGGLFSKAKSVWRAVLVFRRPAEGARLVAPAAPAQSQSQSQRPAPRDPSEPRDPFMSVGAHSPAAPATREAPGRDTPSLGGAKRE